MRGPSLQQTAEDALEQACRAVETTVSRVAKVVLHASALADRFELTTPEEPLLALQCQERVRVLRSAAEAGRRTIWQVELAAVAVDADTQVRTARA